MSLSAAQQALDDGDFEQAEKLGQEVMTASKTADAVLLVVKALAAQEKFKEAEVMAKEELATVRSKGDKKAEATVMLALACADGEEAQTSAADAARAFGDLGNKDMEAAALCTLSSVLAAAKKPKEALEAATKAKDISEDADNKLGEAAALHAMAVAQAAGDSTEQALEYADQALDLYLELKDKKMEASELMSMAQWQLDLGKAGKALSDAEDSLEILQELGSAKEIQALSKVFMAHMARGDMYRAGQAAKDGVERYQESGKKRAEAEALEMFVNYHCKSEKYDLAVKYAGQAMTLYQELENKKAEARLMNLISGLNVITGNYDNAALVGDEALSLLQEGGDTKERTEAMFNVADSYILKQEYKKAADVINDMRNLFQKEGDGKAEAGALMALCAVYNEMESYDQAMSAVSRAQVILGEEGESLGEAHALRMLADVHMKKKEYKPAVRASERARTLFRELGVESGEAAVLFTTADASVQSAVAEGAKVGAQAKLSKAATDALDKAGKTAEMSVKLARELDESKELLASSLCCMAQVHMLKSKVDDALEASDEAVVLFREAGDFHSEASALLLSADALRVIRNHPESKAAATEALSLFKQYNDTTGEELAQQILDFIQQVEDSIKQQQMAQQNMWANQMPMQMQQQQQDMPQQATSVARQEKARGPALDVSGGLELTVVRNKVLEIAARITGAEDGEIEADTPLMEAGLTSNSAILLRDELSQELPGISLPVTLVFDYPSISSMSDLIVESSKSKKR